MTFENIGVYNMLNALRGMRNPMNGAALSDSHESFSIPGQAVIGPKDYDLARRLILAGEPHRKFLRQIFVSVDLVKVPSYWLHEFATYKIGTTLDCSSTMHKIMSHELTADDFEPSETRFAQSVGSETLERLNVIREKYLTAKELEDTEMAEMLFRDMKRMLPHSYLYERMTWSANYETLSNIYYWRHNHRLPAWHVFCEDFIEKLPYSEFITWNFPEKTTSSEPLAAR